jgi:hypothetical protein
MEVHIRILAILHIALAIVSIVAVVVILAAYGGPVGVLHMDSLDGNVTTFEGMVWTAIWIFWLLLAGPCAIAGMGLWRLRPWARPLTLILSIINLVNIPFGTLVAVYGFWAVTAQEVEPLFDAKLRRY